MQREDDEAEEARALEEKMAEERRMEEERMAVERAKEELRQKEARLEEEKRQAEIKRQKEREAKVGVVEEVEKSTLCRRRRRDCVSSRRLPDRRG